MSKPSRTIRWDDPAYSVASSEESSGSGAVSLSNNSINLPAGNLAIKSNTQSVSTTVTSTSWRELKTRDGRVYFYNSVTQKTVWEMPQEYREYLEFSQSSGSSRRSSGGTAGDDEFWDILRERRVTSKWTWEETLRAIITHPNYKCIPTLQERKASFQRYSEAMKSIEEEEARLQCIALKESFKALLASDPQITSDTKWSEVVDKHGKSEPFLAVQSSRERVQLFEEYQSELRRCELENVWARRKEAAFQISEILKGMNLSIDLERGKYPDWFSIKDKLIGTIPDIDSIEYLLAFEDHCHELEKQFQAARKAERQAELLKELEFRESFIGLLDDLVKKEELTPFSTWSSISPLLKDTPEYNNLLSIYLYGSSPIDLFYDSLDRVQMTYETDRKRITSYFKSEFMTSEAGRLPKKFSSYTQFKEVMKEALNLENPSVKYAFIELYGEDSILQDRHRINAYKHLLKHLSPPIKLTDSWETLKEKLKGREEFEGVECEEDRELYFLKFKKWLVKHSESNEVKEEEEEEGVQKYSNERNHNNVYNEFDDHRDSKKSRWDKRGNDQDDDRNKYNNNYSNYNHRGHSGHRERW